MKSEVSKVLNDLVRVLPGLENLTDKEVENNWQETSIDECLKNASKIAKQAQSITHKEEYEKQKKALEAQTRKAEIVFLKKTDTFTMINNK